MIPQYNFPSHIKGDTFYAKQFTFLSSNNDVNTPIDLSNCYVLIQFRENQYSDVIYYWSTEDNTVDMSSASNGIIILKERILDVAQSTYMYDMQITDSFGKVTTYFSGTQKIIQDISY